MNVSRKELKPKLRAKNTSQLVIFKIAQLIIPNEYFPGCEHHMYYLSMNLVNKWGHARETLREHEKSKISH